MFVSLSYTMCNRYERCPELARAWKFKEVQAHDKRPFFKGIVVHAAFEAWLMANGTRSLVDLFVEAWPQCEATEGPVHWKTVTDRQEEFASGVEVCRILERDVLGIELLKLGVVSEQHISTRLGEDLKMYAKADVLAYHPAAPIVYAVEMKSGKTFDRKQLAWYAAVVALRRQENKLPPLRIIGLSLRPALVPSVERLELTTEALQEQIERARTVGTLMQQEQWTPKPGSYCSICEARGKCPDYQSKFGHIKRGVVGLG